VVEAMVAAARALALGEVERAVVRAAEVTVAGLEVAAMGVGMAAAVSAVATVAAAAARAVAMVVFVVVVGLAAEARAAVRAAEVSAMGLEEVVKV